MRDRTISRAPLTNASKHGMVKADHPMLAGHFPGRPIVPGAWLLAWVVATATRQLAAVETRSIAAIKRVKFLRPLAPDQGFECALNLRDSLAGARPGSLDTMRFEVTSHGDVIAEGSLLLKSAATDPAR